MLQFSALTIAFAALQGCGDRASAPDVAPVPELTEAEANARTTVPLTRSVSLEKPGVIADFEFELPPPGRTAVSELVIGLRIEDADSKVLMKRTDLILSERLPAEVRLVRLDGPAPAEVPLRRISSNLRERLPIEADGRVPGVTTTSVDNGMLRDVGLVDDRVHYQELELANADAPGPGRYRIIVRLAESRPTLTDRPAELLVAYSYLAK
ncbi:hypothetical protein [Stenotrophomonas sp. CFBP 13725]|uniref:hypothetical protein n=1 Tax=Stenotrophomonas sp. CFBP 13725 TaxID=2775297 RepID=UPI00177D27D0|nr:hypothetical protein [Stenotrophomonas sp. CFBP 13725]MBD8637650.1 hypothetical protein [Stenotrophomonas sp. CFBP 13725]